MKNNKKRGLFFIAVSVITVLLFLLFNKFYNDQPNMIKIKMKVMSEVSDQFKIYYDLDGSEGWNEEEVENESYKKVGKYEVLSFSIPAETTNIRIDFGGHLGTIQVKDVTISNGTSMDITSDTLDKFKTSINNMKITYSSDETATIDVVGEDPYIIIKNVTETFASLISKPSYITILCGVLAIILGIIIGYSLMELKNVFRFLKASVSNKRLIWNLAKNDFKQKYATSYLGVVWGVINPLITIAVYWFVFQVGLRQTDVGDKPFILWFIAAIIPWFFFQEGFSACTNVFIEYSYLVKKVVFKIETLPVIKIISTLFVHLFFILFLITISSIYGFYPNIYMMQFIYYSFSMIVLVYCLTVFTSAVVLFFRDLGQIIGIIINVGFWATPIGWNLEMLPQSLQTIFKLNPMFYIVNGYRDAFLENIFFWQRPYQTLYFWVFCLVILLIGVKVFNKLKPHFSDVI